MENIFAVPVADVQYLSLKKIGRMLTDDELYTVKKGVEFGLECWEEVVIYAIENVQEMNLNKT